MNRDDVRGALLEANLPRKKKASLTLDEELLQWMDEVTPNRSRFVNDLLRQAKKAWNAS